MTPTKTLHPSSTHLMYLPLEMFLSEKLKGAVFYPIHKEESKITRSNYRPIYILPILRRKTNSVKTNLLRDCCNT